MPALITIETTDASFALGETIILDPDEIDTARVPVDITAVCKAEGLDWGDAAIEAFMAETSRGQLPIDFRVPNRQIQIPLVLRNVAGMSFFEARSLIQAKVGLFQRQGGSIKRLTGVGAVFADVVNASLHLGGGLFQAVGRFDADAVLTLETIPDFYQDEIQLDTHLSITNELTFTETAAGDFPGRVRIYLGAGSLNDQRGAIWSIRSRHYSPAPTAQIGYDCADLTPLDSATIFGGGVQHADLSTGWTPVVSTAVAGVGHMTHTGSYRVWVQATSPSTTVPQLRLAWDVGDFSLPVTNDPVTLPSNNNTYWMDLGQIRLDPPALGTHRWQGMVQARGTAGGEQVLLARLLVVNVDDGYGVLRAPTTANIGGFLTFLARDEFNQSAGNLTGKTAAVGGAWAGAGDANDFVVEVGSHTVRRTALSDTAAAGRYAISGVAAFADQVVQVDVTPNIEPQVNVTNFGLLPSERWQRLGVVARYVNTSNWLMASLASPMFNSHGLLTVQNPANIQLVKNVAGTQTLLGSVDVAPWSAYAGLGVTIRLLVDALGNYTVWAFLAGGDNPSPVISGQDAVLATGGALDDGKPGFYDEFQLGASAGGGDTRIFDNFVAYTPEQDAVLFGGNHAQIATDGAIRGVGGDVSYGPVTQVTGDLPRFPPGGLEAQGSEFFIRTSRGDFDSVPDTVQDGLGAVVYYRPSWLFVPGLAESVVVSEAG